MDEGSYGCHVAAVFGSINVVQERETRYGKGKRKKRGCKGEKDCG